MNDGRVLFTGRSGADRFGFWTTDGTADGTGRVKDIRPGAGDGFGFQFFALGDGRVLFTGVTPELGEELWVTDGTAAGTQLVKDIRPFAYSSVIFFGGRLGDGRVMFSAFTDTSPATGQELWITDGTEAGTFLLKDIASGPDSSFPETFHSRPDGKVFFRATDLLSGVEPWITDGTATGTVRLPDINPGIAGSYPGPFVSLVVNPPPELALPIPDAEATEGRRVSLTLPSGTFTDPGDTLSYSAALDGGGALPSWLAVDPATGRLFGTVPFDSPAFLDIRITATDTAGRSTSDVFRLSLVNLVVGTSGSDSLSGEDGRKNILRALEGDDLLRGGDGDDTLNAGGGDDVVFATAGSDVILGGAGSDTLSYALLPGPVTVDLRLTTPQEVAPGVLHTIAGIEHIEGSNAPQGDSLTGNAGANLLSGMDGNDRLFRGAGNDVLAGDAGDDLLRGEGGDDLLSGGPGFDRLFGGPGADVFVFYERLESPQAKPDRIFDFNRAEGDVLDLSSIDADGEGSEDNDAFTWLGLTTEGVRFTGAGAELLARLQADGSWRIMADSDGDRIADFAVIVFTTGGPPTADWFLL
jgi:ELWxxDGT repeat protein